MKTTKLISTISFNTHNFVQGTIQRLLDNELIVYSHWITHKPEAGELKAHIHLVLEPAKAIDTQALSKEFIEPVPNEQPLRTLPWTKSKISDWILYALHHKGYLATKFQTRKYEYTLDDIQTTDRDLLQAQYNEALGELNPLVNFVKQWYEMGRGINELILTGAITPQNLMFATAIYNACHRQRIDAIEQERNKQEQEAIRESIAMVESRLNMPSNGVVTATPLLGIFDSDLANAWQEDTPPF